MRLTSVSPVTALIRWNPVHTWHTRGEAVSARPRTAPGPLTALQRGRSRVVPRDLGAQDVRVELLGSVHLAQAPLVLLAQIAGNLGRASEVRGWPSPEGARPQPYAPPTRPRARSPSAASRAPPDAPAAAAAPPATAALSPVSPAACGAVPRSPPAADRCGARPRCTPACATGTPARRSPSASIPAARWVRDPAQGARSAHLSPGHLHIQLEVFDLFVQNQALPAQAVEHELVRLWRGAPVRPGADRRGCGTKNAPWNTAAVAIL